MERPDVIVDIGAGTGIFSIALLKKSKFSKIYACDLSDVMIQWMKENISAEYPGIIPLKTKEHNIPLDDGIADLVFMINLHHELDNPFLTVVESNRILKPDGTICIVDWAKKGMQEDPPIHIRYLPEQVKEQLENAGFHHVDIYNDLQKHFMVTGKK